MQVTKNLTAKAMSFANARRTLDAIKDENSNELYALNVSDMPDAHNRSTQKAGIIWFRCTAKGAAKDSLIRIPDSFVPINLTVQGPCTKDDLLQSADLQRLMQTKRIRLLTSADAKEMIETDSHSLIEYDRAMSVALKIEVDDNDNSQGDMPEQVELTVINNDLIVAVDAYKQGQITLPRLVSTYRRLERQLKTEDVAYATREVPELLR